MNKEIVLASGEILRDLPEWEGLYKVSDNGKIINSKTNTVKKPQEDRDKYLRVNLWKNGKEKLCFVHRAVARAFPEICGEWFEGCEINHLNEKVQDNRACNLRVCDRLTNVRWGTGIERKAKKLINNKYRSKPVAQYDLDGKLLATYPSAAEAARQTGVNKSNICSCCRGLKHYYTAGGFIWKFIEL